MTGGAIDPRDYDCTACGACCKFAGQVLLARAEAVRRSLTTSVDDVVGLDAADAVNLLRMRRTNDNRCVALDGEIGRSCGCSIYGQRPQTCRDFQVGSLPCLGCRGAIGL